MGLFAAYGLDRFRAMPTSARSAPACSRTGRSACRPARRGRRRSSEAFEAYHASLSRERRHLSRHQRRHPGAARRRGGRGARARGRSARRSRGRRGRRLLQGRDPRRGVAASSAGPAEVTEVLAAEPGARQRGSWRPLDDHAPARHGRRPSRHGRGRAGAPCSRRWRRRGSPISAAICSPPIGAAEARIGAEIDALLDDEDIGFAFGALACGADLLIAEAALARGVELHVVLPFEEEDFLAQSVRPGRRPGWEARYRACIAPAPRASASPARWPISATPPNTAMAAGWRWAWPGCAPSISPPSRCRSRSGTASPRTARPAPAPTSPPGPGRAGAAGSSIPAPVDREPRPARSRGRRRLRAQPRRDPVHRFRRLLDAERGRAAGFLGRGDARASPRCSTRMTTRSNAATAGATRSTR